MRTDDVIGLIPCGGHATRIAPLPCSKEVLPVGLRRTVDGSLRPKVVSHYLLEKMRQGGVRRAFFILRNGKWDIPQYYGDGSYVRNGPWLFDDGATVRSSLTHSIKRIRL